MTGDEIAKYTGCKHELLERLAAVKADGMCPLCLVEELDRVIKIRDHFADRVGELRSALSFYAEEKNYHFEWGKIIKDTGLIAREALKGGD